MTLKKYQQIKIVLTIIMAIVFSQFFFTKNFIWPLITLISSSSILIILRSRIKEVVADERDYAIAGKSASWAIQIYSWIAVAVMLILYSFEDLNQTYEPIALTLAYSTCLLMFIYSLIFKFQSRAKFIQDKNKFIIFAIVLAMFAAVFTLRFFSGEDNWVCQKGEWVQHGHPNALVPTTPCNLYEE